MNKITKITLTIIGISTVLVLAFLVYSDFFKLRSFQYTTAKGQRYELKYFSNGEVVDSSALAEKLNSSEIEEGKSMLVSYPEEDLGIAISISDALSKPFTKTCSGTDRLAFTVGEYEVCKLFDDSNQKALLAKVGNKGKHFVVTVNAVADAKRVAVAKDKAYEQKVIDFDLLDYQKQLETILKSIHPLD